MSWMIRQECKGKDQELFLPFILGLAELKNTTHSMKQKSASFVSVILLPPRGGRSSIPKSILTEGIHCDAQFRLNVAALRTLNCDLISLYGMKPAEIERSNILVPLSPSLLVVTVFNEPRRQLESGQDVRLRSLPVCQVLR